MRDADKALRLVGLGVRARQAVVGVEGVRRAAQRGGLALVVVARDASANSTDKVLPLLRARRVPMVTVESAAALGSAAGRAATVVVGISDPALARGIRDVFRDADGQESGRTVGGGGKA